MKITEKKSYKSLLKPQMETEKSDLKPTPQLDDESSSQHDTSSATKLRTYNNSIISVRFSQHNYEKCLLTILLILLTNLMIWYIFDEDFTFYFSLLFYFTSFIDLLTFSFYFFCVLKLRKDEIFTEVSLSIFDVFEQVILLNYLIKFSNFFLFFVDFG